MPWTHFVSRTHQCLLEHCVPAPKQAYHEQNAAIGSVYQCDSVGCGRLYVLRDSQREGLYWEALPTPPPV